MGELIIKERDIVVPGEVLAKGMDFLPAFGTIRRGDDVVAIKVGLASIEGRAVKIIPLSGQYMPKKDDVIIAKISEVGMTNWRINTFCMYPAMLPLSEGSSDFIPRGANLAKYYSIGDYIVTQITKVTSQKLVDITMKGPGLRKLGPGRIFKVNAYKVPRIIGKRGSMVSMIKQATGVRITVGQNGIIWLSGEDPDMEMLAYDTIKKIESEAHKAGLTDAIKAYLEEKTGKKLSIETH